MSCFCQQLAKLVDVEDTPQGFEASLIKKDKSDWAYLMECPICAQLWRIDTPDKYQTQFAVKLAVADDWASVDTVGLQKEYLLQSRGGTTDDTCIWAECNGKRVRGVVYCIDHLYETGARK